MKDRIKQFWDERAERYSTQPAATTDDIHLRELEIATVVQTLRELTLPQGATILDIGCGNGYSTIRIAQDSAGTFWWGLDFSDKMTRSAQEQLALHPLLKDRVAFMTGDVTDLDGMCHLTQFDVAITDRCLINLESKDSQRQAIRQIAKHVKQGGYWLAIENFAEGHENMNAARRAVGLEDIPVRWHNLYFEEKEFRQMASPFFEDILFRDFASSYYFATRVIYAAMCKIHNEAIDYNHAIHQLAPLLPCVGQFSPVRMVLLRRQAAQT